MLSVLELLMVIMRASFRILFIMFLGTTTHLIEKDFMHHKGKLKCHTQVFAKQLSPVAVNHV